MESQSKGFRGYITTRPIYGSSIPTTVQATLLRQYAAQNQMILKIPPTELIYPGCYLELEGILEELPTLDGILMCSLFMLPRRPQRRQAIYDRLFRHEGSMHFVLDRRVLRKPGDETELEELLTVGKTLESCPRSIPPEFIPQ